MVLGYCANTFWNDPEYFVEGYSDGEFGDFQGGSLFLCKALNREQWEFTSVTRRARLLRTRALAGQRGQRHDIGGVVLPAQPTPNRWHKYAVYTCCFPPAARTRPGTAL